MKTLILGPPGTGKTTRLLQIIEQSGVPIDRVALVTFTRAGAEVARNRVGGRPHWFRTLHSLCYELAGKPALMGYKETAMLEEELGYRIRPAKRGEPATKGEMIAKLADQARTRCTEWQPLAHQLVPDINPYQIEQYIETLARFKEVYGVSDYTDLLEAGTKVEPLDVDLFVVDEAQDLTELQWRVVDNLSYGVDYVYWAGDDDQIIHEWAGASIERFMGLGAKADETIVLDQSYRLPRKIHTFANQLIKRVKNRYPKQWEPRQDQGTLKPIAPQALMSLPFGTGDWMLLARNNSVLEEFSSMMEHLGYLYTLNGDLVFDDYVTCVVRWEKMRKGESLAGRYVVPIYKRCLGEQFRPIRNKKYTIKDMPTDAVWYEAFPMMPERIKTYLRRCLKRGEKLGSPRVAISTIHGVKGGECENVVVHSDVAHSTHENLSLDPDSEHRVFYVAVTRAKERLFLVTPTNERHYRWHDY